MMREEMRLQENLGSMVEQDEFVTSVIGGLGPDYSCVDTEVFFHDAAPFDKLRKFVLRRQSLLQGGVTVLF
ncbi:hypothetical protein FCM35_KLT18023 [Carex littledalei]|uniref:Uncharacterized protein n=1 Tax=Carex littledalei TaxID=544730 RepID=A0A833VG54_9POAL|nr:hypothetical protein FCM35_KLT18023 [Carex littledalei]